MSITAFKGFDADMKCRGFQYKVGETYEHQGEVEACRSGFHACENPFDVWSYYGPVGSRFAEVELSGDTKTGSDDSKIASSKITISAEISVGDFTKRCVDWLIEKTRGKTSSGDYAQIGSSGDSAQIGSSGGSARIASSGYYAQIASSGNSARIGSSGNYAQIGSSGNSAKIASSGYSAQIASSGNSAQIGSSGYFARIGSSGNYAQIGSSGNSAQIASSGKHGVISCCGKGSTAEGADGTWISIAEYVDGRCVGFATGCIGVDGLKPDTPYRAKNGRLVEVSS